MVYDLWHDPKTFILFTVYAEGESTTKTNMGTRKMN